jgi:hypothetical protein
MRIVIVCIIYLLLIFDNTNAQEKASPTLLNFEPIYGNKKLETNRYYLTNTTDSIKINILKYYISDIKLFYNEKLVWEKKNGYYLIDVSKENSGKIDLDIPEGIQYSSIQFNLGLDSVVNSSGALGGDLDPSNGMYWAWQSGYINCKIEGKSKSLNGKEKPFQYHLGGYLYPYLNIQTVFLNVQPTNRINIKMDVEKILQDINIASQKNIMSPCKEAVILSKKVSNGFLVK